MKIRAGGGALGQQGAPPCYSSLWETLYINTLVLNQEILKFLIPECKNPKGGVDIIMSVQQPKKLIIKYYQMCTK